MTREECEKLMAEKLHEIAEIYLQYNPDGKWLALSFHADREGRYFSIVNAYWDEKIASDGNVIREEGRDINHPIDYWVHERLNGGEQVEQ